MILVVDDEPIYQKLITNALKGSGYEFDIAEDGYAAIDKIQKNKYEFAIIDLVLPGPVNGNDIVRRIKKINPKTGVLVCSGYANQSIINKIEKAGADAFLLKPFNPEQLRNKVSIFLPGVEKKTESVASTIVDTVVTPAISVPPFAPVIPATPAVPVTTDIRAAADIQAPLVTPSRDETVIPAMLADLPQEIIDSILQLGIIYELQAQERQTVNFTESITFVLSGLTECYYDEISIGRLKKADAVGYESLMKNIDPLAYIELEAIDDTSLCIVSKIEFLKFFCSQPNDYIPILEKNVKKILPKNPLINTDYYKK